MNAFPCPHNKTVTILSTCPVVECPFHVQRASQMFTIQPRTGCVFYDTNLMSDETPSRTQISALSRDPTRMLAPGGVRGLYTDMLRNAKTLHALTHDVVGTEHCGCCGYPRHRQCVSVSACQERNAWVSHVLVHVFKIDHPTANRKAIIWRWLLDKTLHLDAAQIRNGFDLCAAADVARTPPG